MPISKRSKSLSSWVSGWFDLVFGSDCFVFCCELWPDCLALSVEVSCCAALQPAAGTSRLLSLDAAEAEIELASTVIARVRIKMVFIDAPSRLDIGHPYTSIWLAKLREDSLQAKCLGQ